MLSERLADAGGGGGHRPVRASASERFPGRAVHRRAAGRDGMAAARGARRGLGPNRRRHLQGSSHGRGHGPLQAVARPLHLRHGGRPGRRPLRHQGLADLALDRLLVRRHRDPARRRGDPPRRDGCGALHRHRRLGQPGIADPLLAALGALDPERAPGRRVEALLQEPRRLRHGRGRRGARAGERRSSAKARGAKILGYVLGCGEKGDGFHRTRSSPGRHARHHGDPHRRSTMPASRPTTSTTSTPTAPRRRRTTRWRP